MKNANNKKDIKGLKKIIPLKGHMNVISGIFNSDAVKLIKDGQKNIKSDNTTSLDNLVYQYQLNLQI